MRRFGMFRSSLLVCLVALVGALASAPAPAATAAAPLARSRSGTVPAPVSAAVPGPDAGCDPVDVAACLLPFPNDYFTVGDRRSPTGVRVHLAPTAMPANSTGVRIDPAEWNRNDGFSPGQALLVRVPGIDLARTGVAPVTDMRRSLAPDAPVVLLDARTGRRHPYWAELDSRATSPERQVLLIHPARNFDEGARYTVALRDLRDTAGARIPPGPLFRTLSAPIPPADRSLTRRWRYTQRALASLRHAHVRLDNLYLAWDFTVASTRGLTGRALHLRDDAFRALRGQAPAFTVERVTDYTPEQNPQIARQVQGAVTVPSYLDQPGGPPGARMNYGADGRPAQLDGNVQRATFVCDIPRTASAAHPARPGLYGHGLLGSPTEVDATSQRQYMAEANTALCATAWIGMASEDIPNVVAALGDFSRFPSIPDRLQQSFLNFLFLGRAMLTGFARQPAFQDAAGAPLLRTTPGSLVFLGNSQGGILGGALTALAQDFTRASLGVPAQNFSVLLDRSADFDALQPFLAAAYPDRLDATLVLQLAQMLWDRGEADGYAAHLTTRPLPRTPAHRVALIEAFGDHQVANVQTEVEARTIGARVRQPALAPGRSRDVVPFWGIAPVAEFPYAGSLLVVVDSGSPPPPPTNTPPREGADPHGHPRNSPQVRAMIAQFLATGRFVDTCSGLPCTASPT